jgi:hypothetical protein
MQNIRAIAAKVVASTGSRLGSVNTRVKTTLSHLKSSEVAEALIATWCIEFLRVRRVGGFHVAQVITISLLMLIIKAIILEAGRRNNGNHKKVIVSGWDSPLERVARYERRSVPGGRPPGTQYRQ